MGGAYYLMPLPHELPQHVEYAPQALRLDLDTAVLTIGQLEDPERLQLALVKDRAVSSHREVVGILEAVAAAIKDRRHLQSKNWCLKL